MVAVKEVGDLHFHVNDVPHISSIILFGFQQMMVCISALLITPYLVSNMLCAGAQTIAIRVQLIAATFVTSGVATILQTTFGMRLSILHGPSFAFLPALKTFQDTYPCNADTDPNEWKEKMQLISGSLFIAVLLMPLLGLTGLIGKVSRFIGPITIVPILTLLCIGTIPNIEEKVSQHWISGIELSLLIGFIVLFEEVEVPIPAYSFDDKKFKFIKVRVFGQFPYLLGIVIAWFICWILTISNLEPIGSPARTDHNESLHVFHNTPWVQIPLPLTFGFPKLSLQLTCGFVASCIACMIESIGDYGMCARISKQGTPPAASTNRAFVVEGVGSMIAALMGVGTGVTTYAENIAIMQVTKVASRITMQTAGVLLILAGIISKFAAFLAMIPEAIIGGVLATGISMICGVAFSNLQTVDLRLSRNLTIMGLAVILGCTIPLHFEKSPIDIGNDTISSVINTLFKIRMLVGGVIAFILDNITRGATRQQRGFTSDDKNNNEIMNVDRDGYALPSMVNQAILKIPSITKLPIVPSKQSIKQIEGLRSECK